ncbi:hypothetical protein JQK15_19605 [Sphingobium sp. BHU LFT2]|uniref:hypothetical protein n=1 Tax=Sphingobium sp. BHU LFT2 TaxID=2807634 RepID=UPI001BE8DF9D|nr:hypothetical protein [Sphingobium sp. BHU LFT2]MBT2245724.1 hypothetical protein [Sphingobium sp. BHU LFT2]
MTPRPPLGLVRPLTPVTAPPATPPSATLLQDARAAPQPRRGLLLHWRRIARHRAARATPIAAPQSSPIAIHLHCRTHVHAAPILPTPAPDRIQPTPASPAAAVRLHWLRAPDHRFPAAAFATPAPRSARAAPAPDAAAPHAQRRRTAQRLPSPAAILWRPAAEAHVLSSRTTLRLATLTHRTERRSVATATTQIHHAKRRRIVAVLPQRHLATPQLPLSAPARRARLALPYAAQSMHPLAPPPSATPQQPPRPTQESPAQTRTPLRLVHRAHAPVDRPRLAARGRAGADILWADPKSGGALPGFGTAFQPTFSPATASAPLAPSHAPAFAPPPSAPPPDVDRLVTEVMRRIERHGRTEKLRRGL